MSKYTIYKITNIVNGKIYVGKHQTNNLDDKYFGSSKILDRAISKYGKDKFTKEILYVYNTMEDMDKMEREIVNEDFIIRSDTYNITVGGYGGFYYVNKHGLNNKNGQCYITHNKIKNDPAYKNWFSEQIKNGLQNSNFKPGDAWFGRKHIEESKRKIGEANKKCQQGSGNSHYGHCWIYNLDLKESKSILKSELNVWLSDGWSKGRKIKF